MIRDLNKTDKIRYSKLYVESSTWAFLKLWVINPKGMFEDIDFYVAKTFWTDYSLKAKVSGVICGIVILPLIFITFVMIAFIANIVRKPDKSQLVSVLGKGIVFLFLIVPFAIIKFPFSLCSYFAFKKRALFYLLEVDSDYDTSS